MSIPTRTVERSAVPLEVFEQHLEALHIIRVQGDVDVTGARSLGRRLLSTVNDGTQRILLDLLDAEPLATGALLGTVLRMERYALRHDARLVVVSGPATARMFHVSNARALMTIVDTTADGLAELERVPIPLGHTS